jgi:hypothetical protein
VDGAIDGLKPAEAAVTGEAAAVTPMSTAGRLVDRGQPKDQALPACQVDHGISQSP